MSDYYFIILFVLFCIFCIVFFKELIEYWSDDDDEKWLK